MRLIRYLEIEKMTRKRSAKASQSEPRGYGYGMWHAALRDLAEEIGEPKLKKEMPYVGIGKPVLTPSGDGITRKVQQRVAIEDLLDREGEIGPGHVACTLENDEWQALITKLFKLVKRPEAETPEVAAAERVAMSQAAEIEELKRKLDQAQRDLAKAESAGGGATPQ